MSTSNLLHTWQHALSMRWRMATSAGRHGSGIAAATHHARNFALLPRPLVQAASSTESKRVSLCALTCLTSASTAGRCILETLRTCASKRMVAEEALQRCIW
jgi:hypothetical protein